MNKNCLYSRTRKITRLPKYIILSLTRFYFKEDVQVNAKILKSIDFPLTYDFYEHCAPALQAKMKETREKHRQATQSAITHGDSYTIFDDSMPDDEFSSGTGVYELKSVITHSGRTSDEGHYIGWVKPPLADIGLNVEDVWFKANDENVKAVAPSDVLALKGGADSDIAYILVLGPQEIALKHEK